MIYYLYWVDSDDEKEGNGQKRASKQNSYGTLQCLKKFIGDKLPIQILFPELDEEEKIVFEPK